AAVTHSPAASGGSPPSRPAPALSGRLAYPDQESHRESFPYKNRLPPPQQAFSSIDGIEVYTDKKCGGRMNLRQGSCVQPDRGAVAGATVCGDRGTTMLICRGILRSAAIPLSGPVVLPFPAFSPEVEAGPPPPVQKSDRLDFGPTPTACSEQAWPYYEPGCLRDRNGQARTVRLIKIDRVK